MKNCLVRTVGLLLCFTCGCSCPSNPTSVAELGDVGATTTEPVASHHDEPVIQERAVELAQEHLLQQSWGDEYVLKPSRILGQGNCWHVYFKHVDAKTRRPSEGLVVVDKTAGKAKWSPQR